MIPTMEVRLARPAGRGHPALHQHVSRVTERLPLVLSWFPIHHLV